MTEPIETPSVPGAESPAGEPADAPEGGGAGGNKEARFRVERNEARAEAAILAARLEVMNYREFERLAGAVLSVPADMLSLSGNKLSDYLDAYGNVDADKVAADAEVILAERPGLRKPAGAYDPSQGYGGQAPEPAATWGAFLKN